MKFVLSETKIKKEKEKRFILFGCRNLSGKAGTFSLVLSNEDYVDELGDHNSNLFKETSASITNTVSYIYAFLKAKQLIYSGSHLYITSNLTYKKLVMSAGAPGNKTFQHFYVNRRCSFPREKILLLVTELVTSRMKSI